jgi:hypothetical protein
MKKLTLILASLLFVTIANAQNKEEIDYIQTIFGMEKKAIVSDFLKVDQAKQAAFWKVYDEYEAARKELGKKRIDLLTKYANNFESMTPETANSILKDIIKQSEATNELIADYCTKVKKVTDPVTALKFYHIENYILTIIRNSILSEIPFVNARKK